MSEPASPTGLGQAFSQERKTLVVYLMSGYPDRATCLAACRAAVAAGAGVVELGVPYGDPLADGPVIRDAGYVALASGWGLSDALDMAAELAGDAHAVPIAIMTYYNPMLALGLEETARRAREAGVSGFIIPDLPVEAAGAWLEASDGLDTVFLVAPTSTDDRLAAVASVGRGFVYAVSSVGLTGERAMLSDRLPTLVERVRTHTDLPVAVGFGISTPERAAGVAKIADGVIVGSAVVAVQDDPAEVARTVAALYAAVHDVS